MLAELRHSRLPDIAFVREGTFPRGISEPYSTHVLQRVHQACQSCPEVMPCVSIELKATVFNSV